MTPGFLNKYMYIYVYICIFVQIYYLEKKSLFLFFGTGKMSPLELESY